MVSTFLRSYANDLLFGHLQVESCSGCTFDLHLLKTDEPLAQNEGFLLSWTIFQQWVSENAILFSSYLLTTGFYIVFFLRHNTSSIYTRCLHTQEMTASPKNSGQNNHANWLNMKSNSWCRESSLALVNQQNSIAFEEFSPYLRLFTSLYFFVFLLHRWTPR